LMAGIPVLTNIEERFTKSSPMVRLCQVINGLDTVLHTANGRIICGCRWSGHPMSGSIHCASSPAGAIKTFFKRFILQRAMVDSVHWI
ncbi:TPA: hypothetical protein ACGG8Q_004937, partial [Escherichia coli]